MEVDERGHIHVDYDEFIWIKNKDGKDRCRNCGAKIDVDPIMDEWVKV